MKLSLVVLGSILLLSAASFLVLNGSQTNIFKKMYKPAFHGLHQTRVQTLTYNHKLLIDTTQQAADGFSTEKIRIFTESQAMIEPTYIHQSRIYTVKLSFNDYKLQKLDLIEDASLVNYLYNAGNEEDMDIVFNGVMQADSGELLSLNRVPGPEFEMIDTVAKDLLRQAFPSIKRQGFMLAQAENGEEE
jgi:hypothetical protein